MEIKLDSIQIFVSDIEKAKKWYSEILGMALIEEYSNIGKIISRIIE